MKKRIFEIKTFSITFMFCIGIIQIASAYQIETNFLGPNIGHRHWFIYDYVPGISPNYMFPIGPGSGSDYFSGFGPSFTVSPELDEASVGYVDVLFTFEYRAVLDYQAANFTPNEPNYDIPFHVNMSSTIFNYDFTFYQKDIGIKSVVVPIEIGNSDIFGIRIRTEAAAQDEVVDFSNAKAIDLDERGSIQAEWGGFIVPLAVQIVPEGSSLILVSLSLIGLAGLRRKFKK